MNFSLTSLPHFVLLAIAPLLRNWMPRDFIQVSVVSLRGKGWIRVGGRHGEIECEKLRNDIGKGRRGERKCSVIRLQPFVIEDGQCRLTFASARASMLLRLLITQVISTIQNSSPCTCYTCTLPSALVFRRSSIQILHVVHQRGRKSMLIMSSTWHHKEHHQESTVETLKIKRNIRSWEQSTMSSVTALPMLCQEISSLETNPITRTTTIREHSWTVRDDDIKLEVTLWPNFFFLKPCAEFPLTMYRNMQSYVSTTYWLRDWTTFWHRKGWKKRVMHVPSDLHDDAKLHHNGLCIRYVNNNDPKNCSHPNDHIELGSRK